VFFTLDPRKIGIGLVVDGGLGFEAEEAVGRRSTDWPFTVVAGADVLPAGELLDMGRTLGKEETTGVVVRGMMICWEQSVVSREEEEQDRAALKGANVVQTKGPEEEMFFREKRSECGTTRRRAVQAARGEARGWLRFASQGGEAVFGLK
jgi:hypothetical protein